MLFFCWIGLAGLASAQPLVVPERISSLQKQVEKLHDDQQRTLTQRDRLAAQVDAVAGEIRRRKASQSGAKLLPDLTLEELLQRSQEMSRQLMELNRQVERMARTRSDNLRQLNQLYGQWMDQLGEQIKQSMEPRSQELLDLLARARLEREQIRRQLDQKAFSAPPLKTESMARSEDPEELREQTDVVRDEQDKLRRRLRQIESQIAEVEAEKRLERNLRDFVEEQSLFGEDLRTLRFRRSSQDAAARDTASGSQETVAPTSNNTASSAPGSQPSDTPAAGTGGSGTGVSDGSGMGGTGGSGGNNGGLAPSSPDMSGAGVPSSPPVQPEISEGDRTPSVFPDNTPARVSPEGRFLTGREGPTDRFGQQPLPRNLGHLQRERQRVVQEIKKMQIVYDRLQEKVESLPR